MVSPKTPKTTWLRGIQTKLKLSSLDSYTIPFRFGSSMYSISFFSLQWELELINKVYTYPVTL
jgi:hypothetical protein